MVKRKFKPKEAVLTLEDLQGMRDTAKGIALKEVIAKIDNHFLPPKPPRKKKEKKKRFPRRDY